ncbi:MAG: DUF261 family protein [Treponemataceae bacterium]
MIKQMEHPNKKIQRYGCYLLSLLCVCEMASKKFFSIEQIQAIYENLLIQGSIDEDCYVASPDAVLKMGFNFLESTNRFLQIGMADKSGIHFWQWVKNTEYDFTILKKKRPNGFHFTLADKKEEELFDPHPELTGEVVARVYYKRFA